MSEVTTLNSSDRYTAPGPEATRKASPKPAQSVTDQPSGQRAGKALPPITAIRSETGQSSEHRPESRAEQMDDAVARMTEYIQNTQRDLRFSIDEESGQTIVKVLDRQTEEVIRQIPDEMFLKMAQTLNDNEPVHFFSEQA